MINFLPFERRNDLAWTLVSSISSLMMWAHAMTMFITMRNRINKRILRITVCLGVLLVAGIPGGCSNAAWKGGSTADDPTPRYDGDNIWSPKPTKLRVYPSSRFDPSGELAVLEARIELLDEMDDSIKGVGVLHFELYAGGSANRPGTDRKLYAWDVSLLTLVDQRRHYDAITRGYSFRLKLDDVEAPQTATTLLVWFEPTVGKRLEASAVLESGRTSR
jgi:hypothetical protein